MACIYRNCLEALRPYHGILLLYEERELLDKLPLDASPTLKKMLSHASPTNSFRTIASDSDLALLHVRMSVKYISTTISKVWKHDTPFFANFLVALLIAGCHYWPKTNKNNEKMAKNGGPYTLTCLIIVQQIFFFLEIYKLPRTRSIWK